MVVGLVAAALVVSGLVLLVAMPRLKRTGQSTYLDVSSERLGRIAIQQAIEEAMKQGGVRASGSLNGNDVGTQINELRDLIDALARRQKTEAEIFLIVFRSIGVIMGMAGALIAVVALVIKIR